MFIDTHSHIYSAEFQEDQNAMLERAFAAGITNILMPAIDHTTHASMLELAALYPQHCHSMIGLHPGSVKADNREELEEIEQLLQERKFIGIGETGLDFYWDLTYKEQQVACFKQQIEWAIAYALPVIIHSRESTDMCIEIIQQYTPRGLRGVFHCFTGTLEQARAIIHEGFYLGIGGVLTFKNSTLPVVLKELELDQVLLETDAPYLAPAPYRGKRNEPAYLPLVAQKLAAIKGLPVTTVAAITTNNAKKLFSL